MIMAAQHDNVLLVGAALCYDMPVWEWLHRLLCCKQYLQYNNQSTVLTVMHCSVLALDVIFMYGRVCAECVRRSVCFVSTVLLYVQQRYLRTVGCFRPDLA